MTVKKTAASTPLWGEKPYRSLDYEYKKQYGEKIYKVSLNGGMTCPNRDGTVGNGGCIFCSAGGSGDFAGRPPFHQRTDRIPGRKAPDEVSGEAFCGLLPGLYQHLCSGGLSPENFHRGHHTPGYRGPFHRHPA